MVMPNTAFGELIRGKRNAAGLTQIELADAVDMSRSQLIRWENGEVESPPFSQVHRVCRVLGIPLEDIAATLWLTPLDEGMVHVVSPDKKTVNLTMHVRKEVAYDREELRAALNIFMNWMLSNQHIALLDPDGIDRVDIIDQFITVMAGENVLPSAPTAG